MLLSVLYDVLVVVVSIVSFVLLIGFAVACDRL